MATLFQSFSLITGGQVVMMLIGCLLMYLGIKKQYEPTLLVPMGLGTILVNFPLSGVLSNGENEGVLDLLFAAGIKTELFPLLIFIGIGAMIDFGPLLQNPFMLLFGAAAQFGIFFTIIVAIFAGFNLNEAATIGIIGAADGPTAILRRQPTGAPTARADYGRGLLLHGARAYHSAGCHQGRHHQKRAPNQDDLPRR